MGMVAYFTAANADKLDELRANPDTMGDFLFPNDGEDEPENTVDIDKSWHGIHFLLSRLVNEEDDPLALAVLGGEETGEDLGYGPPRILEPEVVRRIALAMASVTQEQLDNAFDPGAMSEAGIYPDIWERDGREALEYLTHFFPKLSTFYQEAAKRGDGAVLWLA